MSFDYSKTKDTSDRLISNFGSSLLFSREVAQEYDAFLGEGFDPSTGTVPSTKEEFNRNVVWTEYRQQDIDGTNVQRGDARLLVAGAVKIGDKLQKNGTEWRILDVSPLQPAETSVLYIAQARQ